MTAWKPLVVCLVVAPCALAQQSPLPPEGVIFDDFKYDSVEWCREVPDGNPETNCDNSGYPPDGSVFGRNVWHTSENGGTDYKRAWYSFAWQEQYNPAPHDSTLLYAVPAPHNNGQLKFEAKPAVYPIGTPRSGIASGFTGRRGTWAAKVNFGDLEPASMGPLIQAFWLIGPAISIENWGALGRNEIDIEWNNRFQGPSQNHHYLSTIHHRSENPWPGVGVKMPLFSPPWPDSDGGQPVVGDWSCKFIWNPNGTWEHVEKISGNKCTRIIKNQSIWLGECPEFELNAIDEDKPVPDCQQYTPNYDPWTYLFIRVTDSSILFRMSSHGWGGVIVANSEYDHHSPNLPLRTHFSQRLGGNSDGTTLNSSEKFIIDWTYYSPDTTLLQIGDVMDHVDHIKNVIEVPRFNNTGLELERPYKHLPGIHSVASWGHPERTTPLYLDSLLYPSTMTPGEEATLVALPPLRKGFFHYTWSCTASVLQLDTKDWTSEEADTLDEPIPGCYVQKRPGGWEADFTFPTEPEVTAAKITVQLEEYLSPDSLVVINDSLVHPITESFWIYRDNSLTSDVEPAAAHQAGDGVPAEFSLGQNAPNAFASHTEIPFALPEVRHVSLTVYDVLGREVARLVEGELEAGFHKASFDASNLPAGVYVYRLEAGSYVESRRMVVAR